MQELRKRDRAYRSDVDRLSLCDVPRHRRVITDLLESAMHGFLSNQTASLPEKLTFVHGIILDGVSQAKEVSQIIEGNALPTIEEIQSNMQQRKSELQSK